MNKIIEFMRLSLMEKEIPLSWGISNIEISKDRLNFDVVASKYQGKVMIYEHEKEISVRLRERTKTFISTKELLLWLDNLIE
ncbi:MAG: hypothetical protein NC098_03895 [Lachnoclostridium sp.]|nr:hypothetical protein [Lachnoclostridium sp.]